MELFLSAVVVSGAAMWCVHRLTTHAVTITHRTPDAGRLINQWWTRARFVPEPAPAITAEPVRPEEQIDEAVEGAVRMGMASLREMYRDSGSGQIPSDDALEAEAREMVLDTFGA